MAITDEEKQKLIKECRICDIDLKGGLKNEANKIANCGSGNKKVNYGEINKIVKKIHNLIVEICFLELGKVYV